MSAATNAPRIEPIPPMMMTTNARIRMFSRHPDLHGQDRSLHHPAKPASAAPRTDTSV